MLSYHNTTICPAEIFLKHLIIQTNPLVVLTEAYEKRGTKINCLANFENIYCISVLALNITLPVSTALFKYCQNNSFKHKSQKHLILWGFKLWFSL